MPAFKSREKNAILAFSILCQAVPGCARRLAGVGSAEGFAASGREMEIVLLCFLTAVWTRWFWSVLILWSLAESVVILRRWEGLIRGA